MLYLHAYIPSVVCSVCVFECAIINRFQSKSSNSVRPSVKHFHFHNSHCAEVHSRFVCLCQNYATHLIGGYDVRLVNAALPLHIKQYNIVYVRGIQSRLTRQFEGFRVSAFIGVIATRRQIHTHTVIYLMLLDGERKMGRCCDVYGQRESAICNT